MPGPSWPQKPPIGTVLERNTLTQGLVGFWALNEGAGLSAYDSAGACPLAANGFGSTNPWSAGAPGYGVLISIANAYVGAVAPAALRLNPPLSFAVTFRTSGSVNPYYAFGVAYNSSQGSPYICYGIVISGTSCYLEYNNAGSRVILGPTTIALNADYVAVGVIANGSQTLDLNGTTVISATNAISSISYSASSTVVIGSAPGLSTTTPNALTYWAGVASRAWSSQERLAIGASPNAIWPLIYKPSRTRSFSLAAAAIPVNYTVTGPATLTAGQAGTYTVQPAAATTDTVTVSDGGHGGTITPSSLSWSNSSAAQTFTYSNATAGTYSLTPTSAKGGTVSGSPITVTVASAAPAIIVRRPSRWAQKPPVGTPIDPSSSLSQGLILLAPLNEGTGSPSDVAAARLPFTPEGAAAWVAGPSSVALSCVASGAGAYAVLPAALQLPFPLTVACGFVYQGGTPTGNANIFGLNNTTSGSGVVSNARIMWDSSGASISGISAGMTAPTGQYVPTVGVEAVFGLTVPSGNSSVFFYVRGQPYGTFAGTAQAASWSSSSNAAIGQIPGLPNRTAQGVVTWAAAWNRALSADEHALLAANPWRLFRAARQSMWAATPAPAPTGGVATTPTINRIVFQFDEAIVATSLAFAVTNLTTSASVPGSISYDPSTYRATFTPSTPFTRGTKYQVTVSGATATDGTPMVPETFIFDPGTGGRLRFLPGRGRRLGRLTA